MKPQVFTMTTSASLGSARQWPDSSSSCPMASESTSFLAHPSVTTAKLPPVASAGLLTSPDGIDNLSSGAQCALRGPVHCNVNSRCIADAHANRLIGVKRPSEAGLHLFG